MAELIDPKQEESWYDYHKREQEEFEKNHPVLDTRYYVQEWRKAYTPWFDPYDDEVPAKLMQTFGPFTKKEYAEFLAKYKPSSGDAYDQREFKTKMENLRHYSYDKWGR